MTERRMRFGPTTLHNFGPFAHVTFDFSKAGLTGIEGLMHDRPGCTSNGSGKSYLLDGLAWVCFDRALRDRYSKDDLIRLLFRPAGSGKIELVMDARGKRPMRPSDGCYGVVNVVGGAKEIRVERYRGHPTEGNRAKLFIDGKDATRGKDVLTNLAIEEALGMDFRSFASSIAFGAREDVKSFFSATDTERKQLLDKLLGMEVYASAQKVARGKLKQAALDLEEAERAEQALRSKIEHTEATLAEMASAEDLAVIEFEWKRARALVSLARCEEERLSACAEDAKSEVEKAQKAAEGILAVHRDAVEEVRLQRKKLEARRRTLSEEKGEHAAIAKSAARDIERWAELGGKRCPTCEQPVGRPVVIRSQRSAIARRDKALDAVKQCDAQLSTLAEEVAALEDPAPPETPALDAAREELRGWMHECQDWSGVVQSKRQRETLLKRAYDKAKGQSDSLVARITALREELRAMLEETLAGLRLTTAQLEFWVEGFGPGGLRSFLIEAEVPEINRVATRYAQRLLGPGTTVQVSATKTLATGDSREELTVGALIPGCTLSYAGASKGQRKRLDLSILLAFREIVERRSAKSFNQLFADELFDGLDSAGEEAVVELLGEIAKGCPVALVTHSDVLKSAADRLIVVHHRDGVAELEEVG